jgi:hypothetical protein
MSEWEPLYIIWWRPRRPFIMWTVRKWVSCIGNVILCFLNLTENLQLPVIILCIIYNGSHSDMWLVWLYCVQCHFQQYFSFISWRSVLLMEETAENHQPAVSFLLSSRNIRWHSRYKTLIYVQSTWWMVVVVFIIW